jgi:L-ascorbate metabolism protein UlaG (beta-lactamase superfamily)
MSNQYLFSTIMGFTFVFNQLFPQKAFNDTIQDSEKKLIIHVLGHSSVFIEYDTLNVYIDPYSKFHDFTGNPKADLFLVTHGDADHFDISAINKIDQKHALMVYPQICANAHTYAGNDTIMDNSDSIHIMGLPIQAVPAYNLVASKHPKGVGNGYVVQFGNKRIYISGDTEKIPEMKDLKDIDVAFLGLSQPYNMTPEMMVEVALLIKPKVLIPYHYDNNDPSALLELMKDHPEIKVLTGEDTSTGVQFMNENDNQLLYPNPARDVIYFNHLKHDSEVSIIDINGKLIAAIKINDRNSIDINKIPSGFYMMRIRQNEGYKTIGFVKY